MAGTCAIVVAGGSGLRMGAALPKQFLPLGGRPILDRTLSALAASPSIDSIVVALPADMPEPWRDAIRQYPKVAAVVDGGAERQDSVRNALRELPPGVGVILVHDGVRPFVSQELIEKVVTEAHVFGAVVPVVPVTETLKVWDPSRKSLITADRTTLMRAQTPQGFQADILREAYSKALESGFCGTDDASLVEAAGYPVMSVPGDDANLKITTPDELRMAEGLVRGIPDLRVGLGGDAHRLAEGRPLWLGGILVPHDRGLLGHSDADVLLHAVADAIYGAIGDRDIGFHFPPGAEETKDISSRQIVAHARGRMASLGFGLLGLDAVVVCEEPRILPLAEKLRASIAELLGVPVDRVSLKGKTTEGMGFEGRKEGISAWAVALVRGEAGPA
ncbi:MAG TPA: 2-C-methyl-D-erythritol 4-phosphate cytidylyltransferase [Candidatus Deferrimicrobiaceae bacterium]|jgi:2-C-methyl-D-erythritol 4-phosphate cytidylyltransferase/2-C-methyl-D-erythritol 2,4-cyclodiphosphate synthase